MTIPIVLDRHTELPLYKQLVDCIVNVIDNGKLEGGKMLPSTRELAQHLNVGRITVTRAYAELARLGYIEQVVGSGTFVRQGKARSHPQTQAVSSNDEEQVLSRLSLFSQSVNNLSLLADSAADYPEIYHGAPVPEEMPLKDWHRVLSRHLKSAQITPEDYRREALGHLPLRQAIAKYLARTRDISCSAEQVAVFASPTILWSLLPRMLADPGDTVAVEEPGFVAMKRILLAQGVDILPVPVDEEGLQVDVLENLTQKVKFVFVSPAHQEPTGAVMSQKRRKQLLQWAQDNDAFIIEDDYDCEYRFGNPPPPALQSMDPDGNVIYAANVCNLMFPVETMAYVVVPPHMVQLLAKCKEQVERSIPLLQQKAMAEMFDDGYLEKQIRKNRSLLTKRRQQLIASLTRNLGKNIFIAKESAGDHILVRFQLPLTDRDLLAAAHTAKLPMVSTAPSYLQDPPSGEFIISFTVIDPADIESSISKFAGLISATANRPQTS